MRLVWAVYCDEKPVYVIHLNDDGGLTINPFGINATLAGENILPGFTLSIRDIFP